MGERRRSRENLLDKWVPKTQLGKMVLEGQISSIYEIFEEGYRIKEVEIIDILIPDLVDDVIDISGIDTNTIHLYVNGFPVVYSLDPIYNGYNVSYWHEGGFSDGEVVTCRIVVEDIYRNELDFTWN